MFVISLMAFHRNRGGRAGVLCAALGLFAFKNIVISFLFFSGGRTDFTTFLFADIVIVILVLAGMVKRRTGTAMKGDC